MVEDIFFVSMVYVLKIYGQADRRIKNHYFLDFHLELAAWLIGNFSGRVGRPHTRSPVEVRLDKLGSTYQL